jgi:hypothetical protein
MLVIVPLVELMGVDPFTIVLLLNVSADEGINTKPSTLKVVPGETYREPEEPTLICVKAGRAGNMNNNAGNSFFLIKEE